MIANVASEIEADKKTPESLKYPESVCKLIDKYIQLVIRFPIPVYNEEGEQIGKCKSITSLGPVFASVLELDDAKFDISTFNHDAWRVRFPVFGKIHEISQEVTQFTKMDPYVVLVRKEN